MVGRRVARSGHGRDRRVAELHHVAVRQSDVLELDAGIRGQVGGRARPSHELGQAGHVVRLHVRLEHGDDRDALRLGERDVLVDEVGVRIDDGELRLRLAAEQVGGAGSVVVQELAKEHRT